MRKFRETQGFFNDLDNGIGIPWWQWVGMVILVIYILRGCQ